MKKLLMSLTLFTFSAGLFGAEGLAVIDTNLVELESRLRTSGKEYQYLLDNTLETKLADVTTPRPAVAVAADAAVLGVVSDWAKGLSPEEKARIEQEVEAEYLAKNALAQIVMGESWKAVKKSNLAGRLLKAKKTALKVLKDESVAAPAVVAPAVVPVSEFYSPEGLRRDLYMQGLNPILKLSIFDSFIVTDSDDRNYNRTFESYPNSIKGLEYFKAYHKEAFANRRSVNKLKQAIIKELFDKNIAPYMDNVAVVDLLYMKLILPEARGKALGLFGRAYSPYEDLINKDLATKVANVKAYFGANV